MIAVRPGGKLVAALCVATFTAMACVLNALHILDNGIQAQSGMPMPDRSHAETVLDSSSTRWLIINNSVDYW
jgi:hypothetical protein